MSQLHCPLCRISLVQVPLHHRLSHVCPRRHGRAIATTVLRRWLLPEQKNLFVAALTQARSGKRACPRCSAAMGRLSFAGPEIDHCETCGLLWLDDGELEAMPKLEARVLDEREAGTSVTYSDGLHFRPGLSPWENLRESPGGAPVVTFLLLFLFTAVSYLARRGDVGMFVFDPQAPFRFAGLPILLSLFAHANLGHFVGNAAFLGLIGPVLERTIGDVDYLKIFIWSGLAGVLATWLLTRDPTLGASGAIAGLFAAFWITQPNAVRVEQRHRIGLDGLSTWTTRMPISVWGLLWLGSQLLGFLVQKTGGGSVNYAAHLGGFVAGATFALASDLRVLTPKVGKPKPAVER